MKIILGYPVWHSRNIEGNSPPVRTPSSRILFAIALARIGMISSFTRWINIPSIYQNVFFFASTIWKKITTFSSSSKKKEVVLNKYRLWIKILTTSSTTKLRWNSSSLLFIETNACQIECAAFRFIPFTLCKNFNFLKFRKTRLTLYFFAIKYFIENLKFLCELILRHLMP